jgi:4'-phosphopantetheinyl transferase
MGMTTHNRTDNNLIQWQSTNSAPALAPGGLHLWHIRTDCGGDSVADCLDLLGEHQRSRAHGMHHAGYRERYIRAQSGLRRILGLYLGIPPGAIDFAHGPAGKPMLERNPAGLAFNLTTTADLALVAISAGEEVGIDCERLRPRRDLDAIARRMFSSEQAQRLLETPEAGRLECFYRAWTALEADAKADGRGLFRPRAPGAQPPQVIHCIPAPGHIAAVARAALPPAGRWVALELEPTLIDAATERRLQPVADCKSPRAHAPRSRPA